MTCCLQGLRPRWVTGDWIHFLLDSAPGGFASTAPIPFWTGGQYNPGAAAIDQLENFYSCAEIQAAGFARVAGYRVAKILAGESAVNVSAIEIMRLLLGFELGVFLAG